MLEKLFDFILQFINLFKFWTVLDEYEEGVVLRLGRYHRTIGPGFHWLWPFAFENDLYTNVVLETKNLCSQCLTTKDHVSIALEAVVTSRTKNVKKFLLEVDNAMSVLQDCTYGVVADLVTQSTWEEVVTPEFKDKVTEKVRRKAFSYGIEVLGVQFSDLCKAKCLRVMNNTYSVNQIVKE